MGKPHHKLNVWKKAIEFVKRIYQQLIIARELGLLTREVADELIMELDSISKMIIGLQRAIK
jgi:hypothetical protein